MTIPQRPAAVSRARFIAVFNLIAGLWLFASPWIFQADYDAGAWNNWLIGLLIIALSCLRLAKPRQSPGAGWLTALLGLWTFAAPWWYRYDQDTGRVWNSVIVGVMVFLVAMSCALATHRTHHA